MDHLLYQTPALPGLPGDVALLSDDRSPAEPEVAAFSYRSEAFAEDLTGGEDGAGPGLALHAALLLYAAPVLAALAGGLLTTFGNAV